MAKLQIVRSLHIHKHLLRSSFISFYWRGCIEIKRYRSGTESNNINGINPNEMKHYNEQKSHCLNFFLSPVVTFIVLISLVRWYLIHISSTSLFFFVESTFSPSCHKLVFFARKRYSLFLDVCWCIVNLSTVLLLNVSTTFV